MNEIILTDKNYRSREEKLFYANWFVYAKANYEVGKDFHGGSIAGVISFYLNDYSNRMKYEEHVEGFATEEEPLLGERLIIEAYFLTYLDQLKGSIREERTIFNHFMFNLLEIYNLESIGR